jgi:hypothetical protein
VSLVDEVGFKEAFDVGCSLGFNQGLHLGHALTVGLTALGAWARRCATYDGPATGCEASWESYKRGFAYGCKVTET